MAATKGAALPSMIGASGPSISTNSVIDAEAAQSGQHMFGGGHERSGFIAQDSREFGCGHRIHIGGDLALARTVGLGSDEPQTGIGVGRMKRQRNRQAGMNADTGQRGVVA